MAERPRRSGNRLRRGLVVAAHLPASCVTALVTIPATEAAASSRARLRCPRGQHGGGNGRLPAQALDRERLEAALASVATAASKPLAA